MRRGCTSAHVILCERSVSSLQGLDSDVMDDEPGGATATRKWMSPEQEVQS